MWFDLSRSFQQPSEGFSLREVKSENDWNCLVELRKEIEIEFGITNPKQINKFIDEIKNVITDFEGRWFIAEFKNQIVGEIGIVEFDSYLGKYGRLLDVDIVPGHQGKGLGNQLLHAIFNYAKNRNLKGLCLKADADRWVKDWYLRIGFSHVGNWNP